MFSSELFPVVMCPTNNFTVGRLGVAEGCARALFIYAGFVVSADAVERNRLFILWMRVNSKLLLAVVRKQENCHMRA